MSPTSVIIACILLAATVSLSTSAPISKGDIIQTVTYDQFLGIQIGWTCDQITQYLNGNSGQVMSEGGYGTIKIEMVQYTNTNPIGVIILTLTNNQLTVKAQSGVNLNKYPITLGQYNQITIGMTKTAVTALAGSEGQILSQGTNSIEIVTYNGSPNPYAAVIITFMNDKVMSKAEAGL